MSDLEFEYPDDFYEEVEVEIPPKLPLFKASAILYVTSATFLLGACMVTFLEMLTRPKEDGRDTFFELLEWNAFSQIGAIVFVLGFFMFWLGVMVDKQGV